ncbi:MAG: ribonuclease H-like YkuK family protein [Bacteroidota bacterium]
MSSKRKVGNVFDYVQKMKEENPDCVIHIGCDSQNFGDKTTYVTAIVFRFPGHGAHVIYRKEKLPKIEVMWTKLWGELERSLNLATAITENTGIEIKQIDLDFNSNPEFASHKLLNAAQGYLSSLGFISRAKPNLLIAAWAADVLCN